MAILLLHNLTVKTSEQYFAKVCREFSKLTDSFYRLLFEVFYHNSQDLTDNERTAVIKHGYLKISTCVSTFFKNNKKLLDP